MRIVIPAAMVVVVAAGAASAEPCPAMANFPHALTRDHAEIADGSGGRGGSIVVGALPERDDGKPDPRGTLAEWRFAGKAVTVTHVAPGLDVVAAPTAGTLQSKDGDAQVTVKHAVGGVAMLDAPAVAKLERVAPEHQPLVSTIARLSADPPASAIAIVAFDKTGKLARSWNTVTPNDREPRVFASGGCAPLPAGTVDSLVGDDVVLAWLDSSGRLSKLSAAIRVTGTP